MTTRAILNTLQAANPALNYFASKFFIPDLFFGKAYREFKKKFIDNYENYDNSERLLNMVNYAIQNVPFYNKQYRNLSISSVHEFRGKIKSIDKQVVDTHFNDFFSSSQKKSNYDLLTTGGTSGKPLRLYVPKTRYVQEMGTLHVMWKKVVGYNNEFKATIKNNHLNVPYLINPVTKDFVFDGFKLTEQYFETIYNVIKRYKVKYLFCYPSSAYEFGKYLLKYNKDVSFINAVLTSSENTHQFQERIFTEKLGIKFFSWYGHTEKLVAAGYCSYTNYYHVEPIYGYCELLDENDEPVTKAGEIGEIVGTSLYNFGMPLVRYRTGDYAELLGNECPNCGRKLLVFKKILGRWQGDKVYNNDGSYVTTTALNLHDELYLAIDGLQYYQEEPGKLHVRIIPNARYNANYKSALLSHFKKILKEDTEVVIDEVQQLEKQPNGKFLLLVSKVGVL